jgi:hypothetical protein
MARLSVPDAARWEALAGRVATFVEASTSPRVVANRVVGGGRRWSLEPVGSALPRARRLAGALAVGDVLRTDVATFYPSVDPSVLFASLIEVEAQLEDAREAADMMEDWGSEGYPGLPIGPPGSAVMANAVLGPVDRQLEGQRFLRWVDDYLVELRSPADRAELEERLDEAFERQGLARSEAKTAVLERLRPWPGRMRVSAVI